MTSHMQHRMLLWIKLVHLRLAMCGSSRYEILPGGARMSNRRPPFENLTPDHFMTTTCIPMTLVRGGKNTHIPCHLMRRHIATQKYHNTNIFSRLVRCLLHSAIASQVGQESRQVKGGKQHIHDQRPEATTMQIISKGESIG